MRRMLLVGAAALILVAVLLTGLTHSKGMQIDSIPAYGNTGRSFLVVCRPGSASYSLIIEDSHGQTIATLDCSWPAEYTTLAGVRLLVHGITPAQANPLITIKSM